MKKPHSLKVACMVFVFCAATAMLSLAQDTFTTLANFDGTDGSYPEAVLAQGADGNFYGTTKWGGTDNNCDLGCGTLFKMTPAGTLTTMLDFDVTNGSNPVSALVQAANGDFYGTTYLGGAHNGGTVFKITTTGMLTTLYSFCAQANCADGGSPYAGLVQGRDGNFYGTTAQGGVNDGGTVFKITPAGNLTTIYSFCALAGCLDGYEPYGSLIQAANGDFYGVTYQGGNSGNGNYYCEYGCGTVFEITPAGRLTTLHLFDVNHGYLPNSGLIQAVNGDFYGETLEGGSVSCGIFSEGCGTIFRITYSGEFATLWSFCSLSNCTDGGYPYGPLFQAADGNLYGTTTGGGVRPATIFEITPGGTLTTLYTFVEGSEPLAGLLQDTNGIFYGTTTEADYGTIFSFSTGLSPFVKTQPTSAHEGATVGIFGQGFASSSVVQFGGVQATSIRSVEPTFLEAKVPAGALTGSVTVNTNGTTLTSNQVFRVTPKLLSFSPPNGPVGTQVTISGTGFTQATGVGFGDHVPAQFTVNSDTQIMATVPSGAKTGPVGVRTKGGTAISTGTFTVN